MMIKEFRLLVSVSVRKVIIVVTLVYDITSIISVVVSLLYNYTLLLPFTSNTFFIFVFHTHNTLLN